MPRALPCARSQRGNFPDGRGYSFKLQAHTTCQLSGQSAALALAAGQPVTHGNAREHGDASSACEEAFTLVKGH